MNIIELQNLILESYPGLLLLDTYGEKSFFYNPDKFSFLNRDGVYRLNLGISKQSYEKLFGEKPKRPLKGGFVDTGHDFTQLDILTPHPIYALVTLVGDPQP
jgi:hypothetical protein